MHQLVARHMSAKARSLLTEAMRTSLNRGAA